MCDSLRFGCNLLWLCAVMLNVMKCEFNYMHILQLLSFPPPPPLSVSVSAGCHGIQPLFLSHSLCFNERNNMRYLFINVRSGPILSHCHFPSLSLSPPLSIAIRKFHMQMYPAGIAVMKGAGSGAYGMWMRRCSNKSYS